MRDRSGSSSIAARAAPSAGLAATDQEQGRQSAVEVIDVRQTEVAHHDIEVRLRNRSR
jgi:hypothetical protein